MPLEPAPPTTLRDRPEQHSITGISRFCLFLLPILAVLGPHLGGFRTFGVNLFPYRIAVLAIVAFTLVVFPRLPWLRNPQMRHYIYVGYVWLIWAALGVIWARSQHSAVRGMFSVAFGFLAFLALANLESWRTDALRSILHGWVAAAVLAMAVAIWELLTGNHLPGSFFSQERVSRTLISSTFDNPNNFGVFLLLTFPVLLTILENTRPQLARTLLITLILITVFLSVLTTSRTAIYGLLLTGIAYLFRRPHVTATDVASILVVAALLALLPITQRLFSLFTSIDPRFATTTLLQGSTLIRLNLGLIGIDMLESSFGAGVGGGNFSSTLATTLEYSHLFTSGITDPHNWWIEVLSEYGIIIFLLYSGFLWSLYLRHRAAIRTQPSPFMPHLPLFLLAFVVSGIGPSSFVNLSWQWLYVAIIVIAMSTATRPRAARR